MLSKRISVLLPTLVVCLCALFLCACGEQERQAPDLSRSNIVVVNRTITVNGFEDALYSKDGGATWQDENVFAELVYGSTYNVCVKYKETDDFKESPASNIVEVQIVKTPAETPILRSENFVVNGNRVEIVGFENAQYSADNGETWSTSNIFANLNFGQSYNFKVRIMETADTGASAVSRAYTVTIDKMAQDAPLLLSERVVMNENIMNIIVNNYGGNVLYSKDGGLTSQTSNVFTNLTPGTTYAICIKYAATDTAQESPWSNIVYRTFDRLTQATPILTYANFVQDGKTLTITGFEDKSAIFSIDNGANWSEVNENVFENLTIGATYAIRVQLVDTATHYASEISASYNFTMQKIAQNAPIITADNIEQNGQTVSINGFENAEYSLDGVKWQDENEFANLTYDATYKFYVRYKGNAEYLPSAEVNISYKILKGSQTAPVLDADAVTQQGTTLTITAIEGASYSINGGENWSESNIFNDLTIGTTYNIVVKLNETDSLYESAPSNVIEFTMQKITQNAPEIPAANIEQNGFSITIIGFENANYKLDDGEWQAENVFENLTIGQEYTIYVKFLATDIYNESAENSVQFTLEKLSQTAPTISEGNLSWAENVLTITGFEDENVQYSFDGGSSWDTVNTHEFTDKETCNVCVKLSGDDSYNESPASNILEVTYTAPTTETPTEPTE